MCFGIIEFHIESSGHRSILSFTSSFWGGWAVWRKLSPVISFYQVFLKAIKLWSSSQASVCCLENIFFFITMISSL